MEETWHQPAACRVLLLSSSGEMMSLAKEVLMRHAVRCPGGGLAGPRPLLLLLTCNVLHSARTRPGHVWG